MFNELIKLIVGMIFVKSQNASDTHICNTSNFGTLEINDAGPVPQQYLNALMYL